MKSSFLNVFNLAAGIGIFAVITGCSGTAGKNKNQMNKSELKGSFGYDVDFFAGHNIKTIVLKDKNSGASLLLVPAYQGRVMTSSVAGNEGTSFGWINYKFIEAGQPSTQFNPYGGEERLWLGPEGGPFSIYFSPGTEQEFVNWVVPREIDTEPFEVVEQTADMASFRKNFSLTNATGTKLEIGIERTVRLLEIGRAHV